MPTPTTVPAVLDHFDPTFTPAALTDYRSGIASISSTRSVAWWKYRPTSTSDGRLMAVVDHTIPTAPTLGPLILLTAEIGGQRVESPPITGANPVPGTNLILTDGPAHRTVTGHTFNSTTLAITAGTDYTFPTTHSSGTVQNRILKVIPLSASRAFVFLQTNSGLVKNLLWHLVSLSSTGVSAIIASGHMAITPSSIGEVLHSAFRIDSTRVLLVFMDLGGGSPGTLAVIQDTGSGATIGTLNSTIHDTANASIRPGGDGLFYTNNSSGIVAVSISGTTISSATLSGSATTPVWGAMYPFDSAQLIGTDYSNNAKVIDRATGAAGPNGVLTLAAPDVSTSGWTTGAYVAPGRLYAPVWARASGNAWPRIYLFGGDPIISVGGWGVGMVRMGSN